jgi:hypothetical protein
VSPDVLLAMERFEVQGWEELYRAAPEDLREQYGIRTRTTPFATLLIVPGLDVLAFNRATGLGISVPADRRAIGWIGEVFAAARVPRYFVSVAPVAEPAALPNWLCAFGLRPYNRWAKLVRGLEEDPPHAPTDLRIETIGADRAPDFASVLSRSFEWPPWVGIWIASTIGRGGWRHYLAYDGDRPVATAALYQDGTQGWLTWASTLPGYRARGAHNALLSRRILDARASGCCLLTMETAESRPERPSASYRNALVAGFRVAYFRPNFLHQLEGPDPATG